MHAEERDAWGCGVCAKNNFSCESRQKNHSNMCKICGTLIRWNWP